MIIKKEFPEWVLGMGANYVVGKWGMVGFDPLTFTVIRFVGATPLLFLLIYALEKNLLNLGGGCDYGRYHSKRTGSPYAGIRCCGNLFGY